LFNINHYSVIGLQIFSVRIGPHKERLGERSFTNGDVDHRRYLVINLLSSTIVNPRVRLMGFSGIHEKNPS